MTEIILAFIPFIVAIAFMIRLRSERAARAALEADATRLEQRVRELEQELETRARARGGMGSGWLGVLAHELRSPTAAILGYAELVQDGTLGDIDARARDAVRRMGAAADQLIYLIDGIDAAADAIRADGRGGSDDPPQRMAAGELLNTAAAALRFESEIRSVSVVVVDDDVELHTFAHDALRAVILALGAAIKGSPGAELRLWAEGAVGAGGEPCLIIGGSRLDPVRDDPSAAHPDGALTGTALRLALAHGSAERAGGRVLLEDADGGVRVRIVLPLATASSADGLPSALPG